MWRPLAAIPQLFTFNHQARTHGSQQQQPKKPSVLVVGYGWGSHAFLQKLDTTKYAVQVVSEREGRLNQPSMISSLHATYTAPPPSLNYVRDTCVSLDAAGSAVKGASGARYSYDYLVVSVGSEANDFRIPGVRDNCMMCKTGEDIEAIRTRSEKESHATIFGAGPTGLELACRLRSAGLEVTVYEAADTILPGFSEAFKKRAAQQLCAMGITVHLGTPIVAVGTEAIQTKDGVSHPCSSFKIWTCGIQPVGFARSLGSVGVDDRLAWNGYTNVFGLGDCIRRPPPTAQNAVQQGHFLAELFNSDFTQGGGAQVGGAQGAKGTQGYSFRELGRALDMTEGVLVEIWGIVLYFPYFRHEPLI
jgi:NADH dehydrogenase FAD-containing subunit